MTNAKNTERRARKPTDKLEHLSGHVRELTADELEHVSGAGGIRITNTRANASGLSGGSQAGVAIP